MAVELKFVCDKIRQTRLGNCTDSTALLIEQVAIGDRVTCRETGECTVYEKGKCTGDAVVTSRYRVSNVVITPR